MPVRIVTDSACDLSDADLAEWGIGLVPLSIRFGDDEFVDRTELSTSEFYRRLANSEQLPETSAPSPGAFAAMFNSLADELGFLTLLATHNPPIPGSITTDPLSVGADITMAKSY